MDNKNKLEYKEFKEYIPSKLIDTINISEMSKIIQVPEYEILLYLCRSNLRTDNFYLTKRRKDSKLSITINAPTKFDYYIIWLNYHYPGED